jgi:4'-phosphopantetheinyl transferase
VTSDAKTWRSPPQELNLDAESVHVWLASLPDFRSRLQDIAATLSADELDRARRFRFELHRDRYQLTRGLLRILLGKYLKQAGHEIEFVYGLHGKPALKVTNAEPRLHFNTSHSGDVAVFAVTHLGPVGVDIEQLRPATMREEIARKYFAPAEVQELLALPQEQRGRGFFNCWTRKEAFLKARGDGVFGGLSTFQVSLSSRDARLVAINGDVSQAARWTVSELPEVPEYAGAVAVEFPNARLAFWKMDANQL